MARHFTRWDPELKLIGLRFSNVMEVGDYAAFPGFAADPRSRIWNLWGYIDARDGALAVRLALESDVRGFEAFIIASPDTVLDRPSAELVAEYFPDVLVTRLIEGRETLLSIDKGTPPAGVRPAAHVARRGLRAVEGREQAFVGAASRSRRAQPPAAGACQEPMRRSNSATTAATTPS